MGERDEELSTLPKPNMESEDSDNVNGLKFKTVLVPDLVRQSKGRYYQKVQKGFYCAKCLLKARADSFR